MAESEYDRLRWLCHTGGMNSEGQQDGDLLAKEILAAGFGDVTTTRVPTEDACPLYGDKPWIPDSVVSPTLQVSLPEVETLGDLAEVLRVLKTQGWTKESALYVIDQVWFE